MTLLARVEPPPSAKRGHPTTVTRIIPRLSSSSNDTFNAHILIVRSSDVESLKKGIIHSSKDEVQAQYTILLVGETGVGKSSFLDFITNVFTGNNIDCYDFTIHEQNVFGNQSQTDMAYFYDITSNNGVVVSASVSECDE